MRKLNLYTFHRNIAPFRFDNHNTQNLLNELNQNYNVNWFNLDGADKFHYKNDCDVLIDQGSILIFEFDDTKEFKTFDFGDAPTLTLQLSKSKNFIGAAIGQYNKELWDQTIKDRELREKIKPSVYPETCWQFGIENYDQVSEYRKNVELKKELFWRGSIYKDPNRVEFDRRIAIEYIAKKLPNFHFGHYPLPFDHYINESIHFKLALCFGVGGGYTCGDFCLRDIELYGLGIPTIRPKYAVQTEDPLIPDYHYVSIDCQFDETYRYKNPDILADRIIERYQEVINDQDYLEQISNNARKWYIDNISHPNITNKILKALEL
jgi:hypothetical protein